jgi:hypothetical protein
MEGMLARGVYRDGAFAQVSYDGIESIPISKALYKERGYDPPFEELPTKGEHERVLRGWAESPAHRWRRGMGSQAHPSPSASSAER